MDDHAVGVVPEPDVLETDAPLDWRDLAVASHAEQRLLGRFVGELRFVEEREHALGAGRAALQVLERLRELRKRLREETDVQHERHDDTEFDAPAHREPRADDAHDDISEVTDEVHHRHHQAGKELALPPRLVQVVVVALEPADRVRLAAERLDDRVPAVHLLDVTVDVAERRLLLDEVPLREPHDDEHEHHAQQARRDRAQREQPVVREHHDQCAEEQRDRGDQ